MPLSARKKLAAAFAAVTLVAGGAATHVVTRDTQQAACLRASVPQAEGQPVIVIPGFMNNDAYMGVLQDRLRDRGFSVYGWNAGFNTGADAQKAAELEKQIKNVSEKHDGRKVALVGYSLGGVYAREAARKHPETVGQVVTLGAPFGLDDPRVREVQNLFGNKGDMKTAPAMPTASLYSRADMLVAWQTSQNAPSPLAENIEITAGHIAMPFDKTAAAVAAHQLSPVPAKSVCKRG